MVFITDSEGAGLIDKYSTDEIGLSSEVLMERAALAVCEEIVKTTDKSESILCVCGVGNNGGDGLSIARILSEAGYNASIALIGDPEKASKATKAQLKISEALGITFYKENIEGCIRLGDFDLIVDAIFGTGLSRDVVGEFAKTIHAINGSSARVVSVDVPSGISSDDAHVFGVAVKADMTVTFGVQKIGLVVYPGKEYSGEVILKQDIFPNVAIHSVIDNDINSRKIFSLDSTEISNLMPERFGRKHKGSFGNTLVIAGSEEISGAAFFACYGAYAIGSGLVKVITHRNNEHFIRVKMPEALVKVYDDDSDISFIEDEISWADSVVAGPGLGTSDIAVRLIKRLISVRIKPIILDADAINILSGISPRPILKSNFILTPHLKEFSRFSELDMEYISNNLIESLNMFRDEHNATLVLKDAVTLVSDLKNLYVNTTGNSALSKGGSGDVLAGMIAGLAAQNFRRAMSPDDSAIINNEFSMYISAAIAAVYLHGLVADEYIKENSAFSMLATDIGEGLKKVDF
ncbi:MAG: NAD(P)H-hydrate dehydratase [Lachnospiraceae bacterium]|nr:NAD(P)H-hydrate dehydratase [Lachnospiraceae bacterium]